MIIFLALYSSVRKSHKEDVNKTYEIQSTCSRTLYRIILYLSYLYLDTDCNSTHQATSTQYHYPYQYDYSYPYNLRRFLSWNDGRGLPGTSSLQRVRVWDRLLLYSIHRTVVSPCGDQEVSICHSPEMVLNGRFRTVLDVSSFVGGSSF